ncbi:hypothetical protein ACFQL4_13145 [Halosimplex aquaticum]
MALLTGSLVPAQTGPGAQQIDDRPGAEVVGTADAETIGGQTAKQLSAFLTVPNVIGGWWPWDGVNTTKTDAKQTKIDIYQSAQNSNSNFEVYNASINNYLEDSMSIALMEGKNAYIRSLNNDSSEPAATTDAKVAQDEYYSVKEYNLANRWNNQIHNLIYLRNQARNETGVNVEFINVPQEDWNDSDTSGVGKVNITGFGSKNLTLQNQSTVEVRTVKVTVWDSGLSQSHEYTIGPKTGMVRGAYDGLTSPTSQYDAQIRRVRVNPRRRTTKR